MQSKSDFEDRLLWKEFLNGSQHALSRIYLNNVNDLFAFGCRFTVDKSLVKDSIQDIFVTLIQTGGRLPEIKSIKGYLFQSLKRKIIRESVRNHKLSEIVERGDYRFEIEFEHADSQDYENDRHLVKDQAVRDAIQSLTNRQKEAIYLRFYFGLSHKEIADILYLSEQSSRALISRAIHKIRNIFQNDKKRIGKFLYFAFSV